MADGDVASALGGIVNTLVTCAYALGLAFCSLTLGSWWARRHKVAAAVGVYLAVGWAIALVFSIAGVLAMAGDVVSWNVALTVVSLVQTLANIGVAAGGPVGPSSADESRLELKLLRGLLRCERPSRGGGLNLLASACQSVRDRLRLREPGIDVARS